ncbi:MAG: baseplate assembly protein [Cohaesibacter sp.]|nr:baseplate assembly protein [Cohaesibacter sp.]
MAGFDSRTGKLLVGWPHCAACLKRIFATKIGSRVLREELGNIGLKLILRENMDNRPLAVYFWCLSVAADLWEPRFRVKRFIPSEDVEDRRKGFSGTRVVGDFMPRAHLGDFTVQDADVSVNLS